MCKFCESIVDNTKDILLTSRSRLLEDNTCEIIAEDNCDNCDDGCYEYFKLNGYKSRGNIYINIDYYKNIRKVIIAPCSESLHINYCPYCGKQISKDIKDFNNIPEHIVDIRYKNGDVYDYDMEKSVQEVMDNANNN